MLCLSTPHADCILPVRATEAPTSTLPQHAPRRMHLDVAPVSANASALPQHVLRGLHPSGRATGRSTATFASARPTRIASRSCMDFLCPQLLCLSTSYADCIPRQFAIIWEMLLCLSTSYADCISSVVVRVQMREALPQHVLRGLHPVGVVLIAFGIVFASARPTRIASLIPFAIRLNRELCLSTSYADCIQFAVYTGMRRGALPQHVLRGLHRY